MRRRFLLGALVCLLAALGARATTVSGNLKDLGMNNVTTGNTFVRFTLEGYGANIARVTGTNVIATPAQDFAPDSGGNISGSIQGNDTISVGANAAGGTWYRVCIYYQGQEFQCADYTITGTSWNFNSATPNTTNPAVTAPTGDSTYARLDGGNQPFTAAITVKALNSVGKVEQFTGATADVQIAACLAVYQVCDARGYGATTQTISNTIIVGANQTVIFSPETIFQPYVSSLNMFTFAAGSRIEHLRIDTTNQATYSGIPIENALSAVKNAELRDISITNASGATGPCLVLNGTSASSYVEFSTFADITCIGGHSADGILLENSTVGWVNANLFSGIRVYDAQYPLHIAQTGTAGINGNKFPDYECEADSLSTVLACVYITASGGAGNYVAQNDFHMFAWDLQGSNYGVDVVSANGITGNTFTGALENVSDSSSFSTNQYYDLAGGTYNGASPVDSVNVSNIQARNSIKVGNGSAITSSGSGGTVATLAGAETLTNKTLTSPTINSPYLTGTLHLQGNVIATEGEFIIFNNDPTISSGFGTGAAITGTGSTLSFSINVGTGGTATSGVIGLPTSTNGWTILCEDITTFSTTVFRTREISTTVSSATIGNFNSSAVAAAWAANDILACTAVAR